MKKIRRGASRARHRLDEERLELLGAAIGDLHDEQLVVAIDDEAAELIALGVDQPSRVGVRIEDGAAPRDGSARYARGSDPQSAPLPNVSARRRICDDRE